MQPNQLTAFYKSVKELDLKVRQDKTDIDEIDRLLNYIVCYPSVEEAKIHHRANNIGTNDLLTKQKRIEKDVREKKLKNIEVCNCCGILAQNEKLPYFINLEDLNLGVGVYLFFKNYFFHGVIFVLMFLIYSLFALITNVKIFNEQNGTGVLCFITSTCGLSPIGAGSKVLQQNDNKNHLSQIQSWIGIAFVILWGLLYAAKTYFQDRFVIQMDDKRISASDFTLMLTHIPRSYFIDPNNKKPANNKPVRSGKSERYKNYQERPQANYNYLAMEDITKKFNKQFMDYGRKINSLFSYEVVKINIAKPLYQQTQQRKKSKTKAKQLLNQRLDVFRTWLRLRKYHNKFSIPNQKRQERYEQYMNFYFNEYDVNVKRQVDYADDNVVFVTMRSSQAMRQIVSRNRPPSIANFWNCCKQSEFPINNVKVRRAPEPEQIKWKNVGFPLQRKNWRKVFTWILTIILFGISLGISIGIAFINSNVITTGVSFGISIVVTCVNIGIQMSMVYLSYFQNEYVSSREQTNIAIKIGIAQLVNSIGVPIVVTLISQSNTAMAARTWLKSGGLVDTVFFVAAINILVPIGVFFDPWEIYLKIKRWYYSKPQNRLDIHTQKSFNKHFGNYFFDIGYQYAYLIKTTIFTSFFVCMQPIIAAFAPFGLMLYYLATKRNLLYHFQRPSFHFETINKTVDFMLYFSLLAFGFGNLLVNNFIQNQLSFNSNGTLVTNWVIVIIATGFILVLPLRIFYCCIPKPNVAQHDYLEKRMLLLSDYDRSNPETKETAIYEFKDYIDKLDKAHGLPNEAELVRLQVNNQIQNKERMRASKSMIASQLKTSTKIAENNDIPGDDKVVQQSPMYNNNLNDYKKIAQSFGQNNEEGKRHNSQDGINAVTQDAVYPGLNSNHNFKQNM